MSNFVVHDTSNGAPDMSTWTLTKNKRLFDIRGSAGKHAWLKINQCVLKYGYSENKFNSESPGTVVLSGLHEVLESVEAVDKFVIDSMIAQFRGKSLNNIMITDNTIQEMFRSSAYAETLKVSVTEKTCKIFDSNASLITNKSLADTLTSGLNLLVMVQPSFAWMMNSKIGIRWDAKQIRISGSTHDRPDPDNGDDPDGDEQEKGPVRSVADTLKMMQGGDEEE